MALKKNSYALILFLDLCKYGRCSILWEFDLLKDYPITRSVFYSISTIFMWNLNTRQNMKHYSTRNEGRKYAIFEKKYISLYSPYTMQLMMIKGLEYNIDAWPCQSVPLMKIYCVQVNITFKTNKISRWRFSVYRPDL